MQNLSQQKAQAAFDQCGSQRLAAKKLGVSRNALRWALGKDRRVTPPDLTLPGRLRSSGMTRAVFASQFDSDTRTRNALTAGVKTLVDDEQILQDAQFRTERCRSASTSNWRRISEEPGFSRYRFTARGQIFWTTPATKRWALNNVEGAAA